MSKSYNDDFVPPAETEQPEPIVYDFTVTLDDPYSIQAENTRSSRKVILWILGVLVGLLAVVALIIRIVTPEFYLSPTQRTVHQYFDYLNNQNYSAAFDLIEPGTVSLSEFRENAVETLDQYVAWKIDYSWGFIDMKLQTIQTDDATAHVKADGYLRIVDNQTGQFMNLPYSDELMLVKRNNRWYIRP